MKSKKTGNNEESRAHFKGLFIKKQTNINIVIFRCPERQAGKTAGKGKLTNVFKKDQ